MGYRGLSVIRSRIVLTMTISSEKPKTNLPDADRLSVLAAMILLAYVLAFFMRIPTWESELSIFGVMLPIRVNMNTVVALLVAGLTAAGADWLFHDHPGLKGRSRVPHWLLPALTAMVGGLPLSQAPNAWLWWLGLALGGVLVVLVLVGEYVSIGADDVRQPLAAAGLTALAFVLNLVLATMLRSSGARLFLVLPSLTLAAGLTALRVLNLRIRGSWLLYESGIIAVLVGQVVAALYYLPISALSFGTLVLGVNYALVNLVITLIEEKPLRRGIVTMLMYLLVAVGIALWIA